MALPSAIANAVTFNLPCYFVVLFNIPEQNRSHVDDVAKACMTNFFLFIENIQNIGHRASTQKKKKNRMRNLHLHKLYTLNIISKMHGMWT